MSPVLRSITGCLVLALAASVTAALALAQPTYPSAYTNLKLPILANGTVTSTGRQATSLRDGLRIDVDTPTPVLEVLTFYRAEMKTLGWTETPNPAKVQLPTIGRAEFTKAALTYAVMASRAGNLTKVLISVLEK